MAKLHELQRMAFVCMTGAMCTSPTAALEVLMEVTPLHIVIERKQKAHPMKPQTIKWYTDGSLTDEGSGLGVVGTRLKFHE